MDLATLATMLYAVLVVTAGSAVQVTVGMGLNLFAIPLLALVDPAYVPGPVLAASFLLSVLALRRMPVLIERQELAVGMGGLVVGTALAALVLLAIDARELTRLLGAVIVGAVVLVLWGVSVRVRPASVAAAGATAGIMGTIAGLHAPPIALLYAREPPARLKAALLTFILAGNIVSLLALAAVGRFGLRELTATIVLLPGVGLGLAVAPLLARQLDARRTRTVVLAISALSGLILVVRG